MDYVVAIRANCYDTGIEVSTHLHLKFWGPPIKQKVAGLIYMFLGIIVHISDHFKSARTKKIRPL